MALVARGELFDAAPAVIAVQVLALAFMIWARTTFGMRSFHAAANATECELRKQHGDAYEAYCKRVKRLVPGVT